MRVRPEPTWKDQRHSQAQERAEFVATHPMESNLEPWQGQMACKEHWCTGHMCTASVVTQIHPAAACKRGPTTFHKHMLSRMS